ncbi:MAG: hypothetical protein SH868_12745 [Bythopirellula sp.]|nr:hypothetical protein [Bythopirellula sp.]
MIKALAIKELREALGLLALGVVGIAYMTLSLIGMAILPGSYAEKPYFPFAADAHALMQTVILGAFSLLLGFRQTAWELHNSTFCFILHRPLARRIVFVVKLAVGMMLVVLLNTLFVAVYGWWSATPATHPTPFFWSMTLPAWKTGFTMVLVYLGAFLSGLRPGNWFGSRLAPAAAGILAAGFASSIPWWWLSVVVWLSGIVVLLIGIFYYCQQRDF